MKSGRSAKPPSPTRRAFSLLTVFLLVVSLLPLIAVTSEPVRASPGQWDDWPYYKEIEIDCAKVENENLDNFPVLISWASDSDLAAHVGVDNGDDILFTDSGGTKLDHEIENFVKDNGQLIAWVRVPTLYDNENVKIVIRYGNASASNQENVAGVWNDNFVMVQHMVDNSTSTILDSTSNNNDGTKKAANEPIEADGKIGKAQDFDGNDYIDCGNGDSIRITGPITLEAWVRREATQPNTGVISKYIGPTPQSYLLFLYSNKIGFLLSPVANGTNRIVLQGNTVLTQDVDHYIVGKYDGNKCYVYLDGVLDCTPPDYNLGIYDSTIPLELGRHTPLALLSLNGKADEVRISNIARSAGWIKTTFNNQSDPSSFYSVGSEEGIEEEKVYVYPPEVYIATTWTVPGETVKVSALVLDANNAPITGLPSDNVNYDLLSPQGNLVAENVGMSETIAAVCPGLYENSWTFALTDNLGTWTVYVAVDSAGTKSYSIAHIRLEPSIARIENKVDWGADYLENTIKAELDKVLNMAVDRYYKVSLNGLQKFHVILTDFSGTNVDADNVVITLEDPDGNVVVGENLMNNVDTGIYYFGFSTAGEPIGIWTTTIKAMRTLSPAQVVTYRGVWELAGIEEVEIVEPKVIGYLTLTVLDNETHEPVENAKVDLYRAGKIVDSKYTRWDGKCWLDITVWGIHELRWTKGGYEDATMQIDLVVSSELTLRMIPTVGIGFPLMYLFITIIIGGILLIIARRLGRRGEKKAGIATLISVFVLPSLLLAVLWLAGVV